MGLGGLGRIGRLGRPAPGKGGGDYAASITSPLSAVDYTNEPVGIHVRFDDGDVPSADYLVVQDGTGAQVAFQWEPALHPRTGADVSTWGGGSLKAGTVWVLAASIPGGSTVRYTVRVMPTAQSHSFTAAVTHNVVSGTVEQLRTSSQHYSFENAQAWNLRRIYDQSLSGEDYYSGQNAFTIRADFNGVANYSYTGAHVTQVSHGERFGSEVGAGVVFREWETIWTWANETGLTSRVRYRVWANGKCDVDAYHYTTGALASNARRIEVQNLFQSTGTPTATSDANEMYCRVEYSNKRILIGVRYLQSQFEATPAGTYTRTTTYGTAQTFGWASTTAAPDEAYWSQGLFITPRYTASDHANEVLRRRNPVLTAATTLSTGALTSLYRSLSASIITKFTDWYPLQSNSDWLGALAVSKLALSSANYADAVDDWNGWLTAKSLDGTEADYSAAYTAGTLGIEYLGRNMQALIPLYDAVPATWATALHEAADFFVAAEVASSGEGKMNLHGDGSAADNFNAEAAALLILGKSLSVTADATRQATFDRIWTRFKLGFENVNRMPYDISAGGSSPNRSVLEPMAHYFSFQLFDALYAYKILPASMSGFTLRPSNFVMHFSTALGQIRERQYAINANRRGALSTNIFAAACLAMSPSPTRGELAQACTLLQYVVDNFEADPGLWTSPIDGWGYASGGLGQGMDAAALAASLRYL